MRKLPVLIIAAFLIFILISINVKAHADDPGACEAAAIEDGATGGLALAEMYEDAGECYYPPYSSGVYIKKCSDYYVLSGQEYAKIELFSKAGKTYDLAGDCRIREVNQSTRNFMYYTCASMYLKDTISKEATESLTPAKNAATCYEKASDAPHIEYLNAYMDAVKNGSSLSEFQLDVLAENPKTPLSQLGWGVPNNGSNGNGGYTPPQTDSNFIMYLLVGVGIFGGVLAAGILLQKFAKKKETGIDEDFTKAFEEETVEYKPAVKKPKKDTGPGEDFTKFWE